MAFQVFVGSGLEVENWCQALEQIGRWMCESKAVKPGFDAALVERERRFPTGLRLPHGINAALPHADPTWVLQSGVVLWSLSEPVEFARMDDRDTMVKCHVAIVPLIQNPDDYMQFLSRLLAYIGAEAFADCIRENRFAEVIDEVTLIASDVIKDSPSVLTWDGR